MEEKDVSLKSYIFKTSTFDRNEFEWAPFCTMIIISVAPEYFLSVLCTIEAQFPVFYVLHIPKQPLNICKHSMCFS